MKQGPSPGRGFLVAIPFALVRGLVVFFMPSPWHFCDFMIRGIRCLAIVRVRRSRCLHAPVGRIVAEYFSTIAELRLIPGGGPVSRELWLYSRHGALRFFRVGDTGLEEIDRHGDLIATGTPALPGPEKPGGAAVPCGQVLTGMTSPGPAGTGVPEDPTAKIIRYLKKRNAGKIPAGGEPETTGPAYRPGKSGTRKRTGPPGDKGPFGEKRLSRPPSGRR
jgi:hypothetical protein